MSELETSGVPKGRLSAVQLDVTDNSSIQRAASLVEDKFGHLDVLINNAGVYTTDPDIQTRFRVTLDANVIGPVLVSLAFRPLLLKSQAPYSIFVTSALGSITISDDPNAAFYRGYPASVTSAYAASKAALNMLVVQEAIETISTALKVFAVCPGLVVSNLRGTSEEARSAGGRAGDPEVSGKTILSIVQGERDGDAGKFVHKDGVYPW
jgi:NAD(P)-dependent dehydrogenase (short-subunit alcohol dehydrogenase family)